jgi:hypothetical protein
MTSARAGPLPGELHTGAPNPGTPRPHPNTAKEVPRRNPSGNINYKI